jgi:hypothetical protein
MLRSVCVHGIDQNIRVDDRGSTDIAVDVPPVESAHASQMPDWQFRGWAGAGDVGYRPVFTHELFQQCIHGNALPLGFGGEAGFGLMRDFNTHGTTPVSKVTLTADFTPVAACECGVKLLPLPAGG